MLLKICAAVLCMCECRSDNVLIWYHETMIRKKTGRAILLVCTECRIEHRWRGLVPVDPKTL